MISILNSLSRINYRRYPHPSNKPNDDFTLPGFVKKPKIRKECFAPWFIVLGCVWQPSLRDLHDLLRQQKKILFWEPPGAYFMHSWCVFLVFLEILQICWFSKLLIIKIEFLDLILYIKMLPNGFWVESLTISSFFIHFYYISIFRTPVRWTLSVRCFDHSVFVQSSRFACAHHFAWTFREIFEIAKRIYNTFYIFKD